MWRTDSLEKTLMLGKFEGRRRRGWQRMRWLDGITDGHEVEPAPVLGYGQGSLACCSPPPLRVGYNWATELIISLVFFTILKILITFYLTISYILKEKTKPASFKWTEEQLLHRVKLLFLLLLSRFSRVRLCATPLDGSPPGSPVPGILQARTLEWAAISFSNAWKWKVKVKSLGHVRLATPWTAAHQAPPSMGFSRQKHWSGVPLPSPHKVRTPM